MYSFRGARSVHVFLFTVVDHRACVSLSLTLSLSRVMSLTLPLFASVCRGSCIFLTRQRYPLSGQVVTWHTVLTLSLSGAISLTQIARFLSLQDFALTSRHGAGRRRNMPLSFQKVRPTSCRFPVPCAKAQDGCGLKRRNAQQRVLKTAVAHFC